MIAPCGSKHVGKFSVIMQYKYLTNSALRFVGLTPWTDFLTIFAFNQSGVRSWLHRHCDLSWFGSSFFLWGGGACLCLYVVTFNSGNMNAKANTRSAASGLKNGQSFPRIRREGTRALSAPDTYIFHTMNHNNKIIAHLYTIQSFCCHFERVL